MAYLIISLENVNKSPYTDLKRKYRVIQFKKELHLLKSIHDLGEADIILIPVSTSILGKNKDITFEYLSQQKLSGFDIVWVYKSSRHKSLFNNYRYALRKFPQLNGELNHELLHSASQDDRSFVSLAESSGDESAVPPYKLHLNALEQIIKKLVDEKHEKKRDPLPSRRRSLSRAGARRSSLVMTEQKKMEPIPASPVPAKKGLMGDLIQASTSAIVSAMVSEAKDILQSPKAKKPEKVSIRHKSNCVEVVRGSQVLKSFPFTNKIGKKKASISAKRYLRSL